MHTYILILPVCTHAPFFINEISSPLTLTLNLLTTTIVAPHSNASKWQMGFNSAFKGLMTTLHYFIVPMTFVSNLKMALLEEGETCSWLRRLYIHLCVT
jgi:hypothetical protein